MIHPQRGFTLIELLVVISIIGVLSSAVLAALSTTRSKGKASAIKSGLISLRSQIELVSGGTGYGAPTGGTGAGATSACTGTILGATSVTPIITAINASLPTVNVTCSADSATAATIWSAAVILPDGSGSFCVSSAGVAKTVSTASVINTSVQNNGVCI